MGKPSTRTTTPAGSEDIRERIARRVVRVITPALAVSAVTATAALGVGIISVGSFGVLAALAFAYWAPKYSPLATLAGVRRHRAEAAAEEEGRKQLSGKP